MLGASLSFVPAAAEDLPTFEKLAREAMVSYYEVHGMVWQPDLFKTGFAETENYRVEQQGKTVAVLRLGKAAEHVHVYDLHVEPDFRNRGIGTEVLSFIRSLAIESGKRRVRMCAFKTNPAIALYLRSGFAVVGEDGHLVRLQQVLENSTA